MVLILTLYMDGEIRSVEGYVNDEELAKKKVKKLNKTVGEGEFYSYSYTTIEELY